jgi:hypothetical protein
VLLANLIFGEVLPTVQIPGGASLVLGGVLLLDARPAPAAVHGG